MSGSLTYLNSNSVRRDDIKSPSIKISSPSVSKPLSLREPGAA